MAYLLFVLMFLTIIADYQSEDLDTGAVVLGFEANFLFAFDELIGPIRSLMRSISARIACSLSSEISAGRFMVYSWSMGPQF